MLLKSRLQVALSPRWRRMVMAKAVPVTEPATFPISVNPPLGAVCGKVLPIYLLGVRRPGFIPDSRQLPHLKKEAGNGGYEM